ncbi:nucleotidyltransferase domain-containing protein [Candidatus Woesearchaeota archaeon]|nr:nucleotidyltransferase domain-containing protein [Candidatus Woesearchaeota archaeon]
MKAILGKVLEKIKPSKKEAAEVKKHVDAFISLLNSELKRLKIDAKASVGGSYAKSTWLSGDYDVDVFVRFNPKYEGKKSISDLLESALLKFKPVRLHGSRDYFHVKNKVNIEIVPVLDIKKPSDAKNVTDFSPLHVNWVNRNGKQYKDDIMLAKRFCKAAGCYGAESYIRGFSGHVVDILVIYYKGFLPLLRAAVKWKPKVVIDPNNACKGKALFVLNESKIQGPLVVIDPVQPDRNAAAALTNENFDKFISHAKKFLERPSAALFSPVSFDSSKFKGLLVEVLTIKNKEDVAGVKMVRAFEYCRDQLADFGVINSGWEWDKKAKGLWYFSLRKYSLPAEFEWKGPPKDAEPFASKFRKIYRKVYIKNGFLFTKLKRRHTSAKLVLSDALKSAYVKQRIKSSKLL